MTLFIALVVVLALMQAPPLTKAEQFQDAARKGDAATVKSCSTKGSTSTPSSATTRRHSSTPATTGTWRS